jgi:hypothetical protein
MCTFRNFTFSIDWISFERRAFCVPVGNLQNAATDPIDGYYPVVQRSTKAVIANLRVRLSLSTPTSSPELDKSLGGEPTLADRRPPRVTLRSKTAGPGRRSSGKNTETRSSRCQEAALAPQTTVAGPSDGGKIAEANVRRQEMTAAPPSRISVYSPAKRPPAHSSGRHTETENVVNRPMASLAVPVTQLKRGSSKVTFSDSEAVGPQNLRNSTGRQAYFIKFIYLISVSDPRWYRYQCRPGSRKLPQYVRIRIEAFSSQYVYRTGNQNLYVSSKYSNCPVPCTYVSKSKAKFPDSYCQCGSGPDPGEPDQCRSMRIWIRNTELNTCLRILSFC